MGIFMRKFIKEYYGLLWRLAVVISVLQPFRDSQAAGFVTTVKKYPDEGIVFFCIFMLISGVLIAMKYEPPIDSVRTMSPRMKGGLAFIGGIAAFVYTAQRQENLYLMQGLGVLAVSVTSPALLNLVYTLIVEKIVNVIRVIFGDYPNSGDK